MLGKLLMPLMKREQVLVNVRRFLGNYGHLCENIDEFEANYWRLGEMKTALGYNIAYFDETGTTLSKFKVNWGKLWIPLMKRGQVLINLRRFLRNYGHLYQNIDNFGANYWRVCRNEDSFRIKCSLLWWNRDDFDQI